MESGLNVLDRPIKVKKSRLEGEVELSGAKNSALRLLAASILTEDKIHLYNYPDQLLDAQLHVEMLKVLGKACEVRENEIKIGNKVTTSELVWEERSIRNTLLILGALLTKTGQGKVPVPGGCKLGDRKHDIHEMIFQAMGAKIWYEGDNLCAEVKGHLKGTDLYLPIRSTGATENGIICGSLAIGTTTIWNPHIRPEILDLIDMLNKMGAKIEVLGQERIIIEGVDHLNGVEHTVIPDNMEGLTWLIGSVITNGDITIKNFPTDHLEVPLVFLRESGAKFYRFKDEMIVRGGRCYPIEISTGPYPGINSDMQPLMALYGACAFGESKVIDLRFPGRYGYVMELAKMGVKYEIKGDLLIIHGNGGNLHGASVKALDLRAGIALLLAGLIAEGETLIDEAWQIGRGYNRINEKLKSLSL